MDYPISPQHNRNQIILYFSKSPKSKWINALKSPSIKHNDFWKMVLNIMAPENYLTQHDDGTLLHICEDDISFLRSQYPGKCPEQSRESFLTQLKKYLNDYAKEFKLLRMTGINCKTKKYRCLLDRYNINRTTLDLEFSWWFYNLQHPLEDPRPPDIDLKDSYDYTL